MKRVRYFCQILTEFVISLQICETSLHDNGSSRSRVDTCGQTDGHDEAIAIYTNAPKNAAYFPHCAYIFPSPSVPVHNYYQLRHCYCLCMY